MPDSGALEMVDAVAKVGPALSATSDMPQPAPDPEPKPKEPEPSTGEEPKPGAEDAGKTDPTGDDTGQEPEAAEAKDNTPPEIKRVITREKNRRREAEARAAAAEARLDAALKMAAPKSDATTKTETDDPKPVRETFDNPDAYDTALVEWAARNAAKETERRVRAKAEEDQRIQTFNRTKEEYLERRETFIAEHEDFESVAENPDVPMNNLMASVIVRLENGPELAYHLGKNVKVAERIAKLSEKDPALAVYELGKVAASLAAPKPEVSKAPPPIKPVGSRANASRKTPDEMSMDEYARMRRDEQRAVYRERMGLSGQTH